MRFLCCHCHSLSLNSSNRSLSFTEPHETCCPSWESVLFLESHLSSIKKVPACFTHLSTSFLPIPFLVLSKPKFFMWRLFSWKYWQVVQCGFSSAVCCLRLPQVTYFKKGGMEKVLFSHKKAYTKAFMQGKPSIAPNLPITSHLSEGITLFIPGKFPCWLRFRLFQV